MRNILGIWFSILILTAALGDWVAYFSFKANQEYIAEYLCVNKEKPELNCHGKCHLNAELEKQHGESDEVPIPVFENKNSELVYVFSENNTESCFATASSKLKYPPFSFLYFQEHGDRVFHPPQV